MAKILALETSTLMGSAALVIDGKVIAERSSRRQKSHSEVLNNFIDEVLKEGGLRLDEIDVFATGKGPGSFTGIRVAGNIAKTLAYSFQKPMVAIDSLTLLAAPCPRDLPILSMINAYKNMVYFGLFQGPDSSPKFVKGPGVLPVKSLDTLVKSDCLVVGDGYSTYQKFFPTEVSKFFKRDEKVSDDPMASTLGVLAEEHVRQGLTLDWKSFVPLYIRASEAEENKRGIFIPSL